MSDENGQMPDAIEHELNEMQHLEVSDKCLDIIANNFSGTDALFDHICAGHAKSFMSVIALMSSYRIANQDMSKLDHESNKIACFHLMQRLEEEFRPKMEEMHAQVVSDIYDN